MIKRHMKTIVEMERSGVVHMLKNNRMDGSPTYKKRKGKKKVEGEDEGALGGSQGGKAEKYILCVNTYQMVLLLMCNTRQKVTYEEVREETLIRQVRLILIKAVCNIFLSRELTRALQPLFVGKTSQRILVKNPKTKKIEPSHIFYRTM